MPKKTLRIVTRSSPLALWQATYVRQQLETLHPNLHVALQSVQTRGDKLLDAPLAKIGGKGLFVKELEQCLLSGEADIAVHSMKDVPMELPAGLILSAIMEREDPRDAYLSPHHASIDALPDGACVGTSSLRRQCQLRALRPDLRIENLRGNVGTRLKKLDSGAYDAIILAAAGVIRLELADRIRSYLEPELLLPAIGQGAIGIECREEDDATQQMLAPLNHEATTQTVNCERAVNRRLSGGCQMPVAGFATVQDDNTLFLRALVGRIDGTEIVRGELVGDAAQAEQLGTHLAEDLLSQGADKILAELIIE